MGLPEFYDFFFEMQFVVAVAFVIDKVQFAVAVVYF